MSDTFAVVQVCPFASEVDQLAAAGSDFLQVGFEFFQQTVAGGDADDGHVFID